MPKIRILSILCVFLTVSSISPAQDEVKPPAFADPAAPPPKVVTPRTAPEVRIDEAIKVMKATASMSAELKISADMLNQKFNLIGNYAKAPDFRVLLKLAVSGLADARGTMIQVCDGTTLWNYQRVLEYQGCQKLEMKPILAAMDKPGCDAELRENLFSLIGFVGPDTLMAGLRESFVFDQVREVEWEGKVVYIFGGSWKNTQTLVGPNGMTFNPAGPPLPPYIPSLVTLYLGKYDNFPHQVIFEGRIPAKIEKDTRELGPDGRPIGRKMSGPAGKPSTVTLKYTDVKLNVTIPAELFRSPLADNPLPKGSVLDDSTEKIVTYVEQSVANRAAAKKAEAAKASPALDAPVQAPGPASGPAPGQPPK